MSIIFAPLLGTIALIQMMLAVVCLRSYPRARIPAWLLLAIAPLQPLTVLFGNQLLKALHTPSSFDANADGFEIALQTVGLVGALVVISCGLCVWMSTRIGTDSTSC